MSVETLSSDGFRAAVEQLTAGQRGKGCRCGRRWRLPYGLSLVT